MLDVLNAEQLLRMFLVKGGLARTASTPTLSVARIADNFLCFKR